MTDKTLKLGYGYRRRRSRLLWLGLALVVTVATTVPMNRERFRAWRAHVTFLYWQHVCATWSLPPDTVVYEEDRGRALALREQPGRRFVPVYNAEGVEPPQLPTGYSPPEAQLLVWGDRYFPTTIFLHELRTPGGARRLVLIDVCVDQAFRQWDREVVVWCRSHAPVSSAGALEHVIGSCVSLRLRRSDTLRLFAGQCDPNDRTAFRIGYELNGVPGVLVGRLQDNGETQWKVASGNLVTSR